MNNITKEIYTKVKKQSVNIVLNLDDYGGSEKINKLRDYIIKKRSGDLRELQELFVIKDGTITH